jgi:mRNA-degrading endonuclease toxin of MazEF toxin-antitoxin module
MIGHVYYVLYDPVQVGEFNGKHLSVVLKRNNDKYTFVVMPLTSSANGDGINKLSIGKLPGLPSNIKGADTYAVFDQVRTVSSNRFFYIKSGSKSIDVSIDNVILLRLFSLAMRDILYDIEQDDKIAVLKTAYDRERFTKAKDLAYDIVKMRRSASSDVNVIAMLMKEIRLTLKDAVYTFDEKQAADGIKGIIDEALGKT